jgi:hypothetical protein
MNANIVGDAGGISQVSAINPDLIPGAGCSDSLPWHNANRVVSGEGPASMPCPATAREFVDAGPSAGTDDHSPQYVIPFGSWYYLRSFAVEISCFLLDPTAKRRKSAE